jgi:hypothetical protein
MKHCKKHNIYFHQVLCPVCKKITREKCKNNKKNGKARKNNNFIMVDGETRKHCNVCKKYDILSNFYKDKAICKSCRSLQRKEYYLNNKEYITKKTSQYQKNNPDKVRIWGKKYRDKNKPLFIEYRKKWRRKNSSNPSYKIRNIISRAINRSLKNVGGKNGESCFKYLGYSVKELKQYLNSLFEPWMNWENWGVYNPKAWDDNDSTTWKWQIDHIIPQSKLPYDSMEHPNFQKCWGLENLRPYSAKQNNIDRDRKKNGRYK